MPPSSAPTTPKDDSSSRLSDAQLRKKKNADAQAAFRARRANYIATLEETVTNLEAVVLQLQDSCRDARTEANELRQESNRLRHAGREREKFWRALWQTRKGSESQVDEFPPLPACFGPMHPQTTAVNPHINATVAPYSEEALSYQNGDSTAVNNPYTPAPDYPTRSPSIAYTHDADHLANDGRTHHINHRPSPKYAGYHPYAVQSAARDAAWPPPVAQTTSSGGDSGRAESSNSSHSPTFVESPNVAPTTDMPYVSRYGMGEDQKVPPSILDGGAPYMFPGSRSLSPTSTPPSSSSTSLTSPFNFTFPDGSMSQDRTDFDYRRHSTGHPPEVTLHGGIADISSLTGQGGDAVRYRLGARRANSGADRSMFPSLPQIANPEANGHGELDIDMPSYSRLRPRRAPSRMSRSPSPGAPPMSGTLAVIKAQAFGALRRTRVRSKKGGDGASKVAIEALEARGLGMGVSTGSKRQRLDYEGDEEGAHS
ncbi:hypothetical protein FA95DRAFT_1554225 [Auriscalpium vulgare]|uniref:Uncharacterized protein n=1 Tax=Auriscalpium vulgare TaxID=40419 RepID=A0ACB8S6A2_9AGAM|nr:hypothetical protein FA95DRAFT_1554225 [Auriscalpium vulgare]